MGEKGQTQLTVCEDCGHAPHAPGKCSVLYVYARGPTDPPGNQGCLCGHEFTVSGLLTGDTVITIPPGETNGC